MKVLVVDDDVVLSEQIARELSVHHYQVEVVADGEAGLDLIGKGNYDLVLLDLHLPKLNGISLCQQLRAGGKEMPILMMTAERASASKITGLDAGADDYVTKPLDINELLARMRAVLRRIKPQILPLLIWTDVCLDPSSCEVFCHGQRLHLTSKEYEILELFLRNPHRVFSLDALTERLWPLERVPSESAMRSHVKSVREKLRQAGIEEIIQTVYGRGYRLSSPDSASSRPALLSAGWAQAVGKPLAKRESSSDPLSATWKRHSYKYLEMIASLNEVIPSLQTQDLALTDAERKVLTRSQATIHTLKGTLGSFGFAQASQIAEQIEIHLRMPCPQTFPQIDQLQTLIKTLKQSLFSESESSAIESRRDLPSTDSLPQTRLYCEPSTLTGSSLTVSPQTPSESSQPASVVCDWLIVDSDQQVIESLLQKASFSGIQPQIAYSPDEARRRLAQHVPAVVTIDLSCATSWDQGMAFLAELTRQYPSLPIVVMSEKDTLDARVNIVRSGAATFLQKPVDVSKVLEIITNLISKHQPTGARIVALDDNPVILQHLQHLLSPWGFKLTLLSDPTQFWQALEHTLPDLLILDIEMPNFNGLEICQVIRSDPKTAQIPILFLSAHTDSDIVRRVFEVGADDYVSKPIVGPELVSRILNRLERLRFLRKLAETDTLTGLSRRRQSVETLDRLLRLSLRKEFPLCLALLDLDNFKQINDRYGHDVGDQVLKVFGEYLRKAFRGEDVVARWGGEEFVVGLYDVSKEMAMKRLDTLRESFGQHVFHAGLQFATSETTQVQFRVSLSGGLAIAPIDGETVEALYHHADQALYRAKRAGRNQIHFFS